MTEKPAWPYATPKGDCRMLFFWGFLFSTARLLSTEGGRERVEVVVLLLGRVGVVGVRVVA